MWIAAAIGAAVGLASSIYGMYKSNKELERQRKQIQEQGQRELELMDMQWDKDVRDANRSADRADTETTLSEGVLGQNVSAQVRGLGLQEEMNALAYNEGAIGAGSAEGSANSAAAAAGTRGSSALQAARMQRDLSDEELQLREDYDRASADLTLMGAMNSLMLGAENVQQRRTDARELREDFAEGGDQWNIYQKQRANYQEKINDAVENVDASMIDPFSADWTVNAVTAGLQGAQTGMSIYGGISGYAKNAAMPSYTSPTQPASVFGGTGNAIYNGSGGTFSIPDVTNVNFSNIAPMSYGFRLRG